MISDQSVLSSVRFNYNGIDLNRNFPDAFAGVRGQRQLAEEQREAEVGHVTRGVCVISIIYELFRSEGG